MKTLILDTSGPNALVALADSNNILSFRQFSHEGRLSELYLTSIDETLRQTGVLLDQIDQIAVGVGPGSYTGTRVAVTIGRGFALGRNIPCVGFPSSALYIPNRNGKFLLLTKGKYHKHHALVLSISQEELAVGNCGFHDVEELQFLSQDIEVIDPLKSTINLEGFCRFIGQPSHLLPPLPLYFPIAEYLPNP